MGVALCLVPLSGGSMERLVVGAAMLLGVVAVPLALLWWVERRRRQATGVWREVATRLPGLTCVVENGDVRLEGSYRSIPVDVRELVNRGGRPRAPPPCSRPAVRGRSLEGSSSTARGAGRRVDGPVLAQRLARVTSYLLKPEREPTGDVVCSPPPLAHRVSWPGPGAENVHEHPFDEQAAFLVRGRGPLAGHDLL